MTTYVVLHMWKNDCDGKVFSMGILYSGQDEAEARTTALIHLLQTDENSWARTEEWVDGRLHSCSELRDRPSKLSLLLFQAREECDKLPKQTEAVTNIRHNIKTALFASFYLPKE